VTTATGAATLPHEADAVLLDEVEAVTPLTTRARARVRPGTPFCDGDAGWPTWMVPELMAQAVAAGVGLREFRPGVRPRLGLLLGVRDLRCSVEHLVPGSELLIEAFESTRDERGMGVFDCTLAADTVPAASATLSVYLPDDVDEYLGSIEP
jgi:predicted hotdog family 3-hydroxylacyl-ACP dehydratase